MVNMYSNKEKLKASPMDESIAKKNCHIRYINRIVEKISPMVLYGGVFCADMLEKKFVKMALYS